MLSREVLFAGDGLLVAEVACGGGSRTWSSEESVTRAAIVLVRSGLFRRRVHGVEFVADPMLAYVERPGTIQQIAHPNGGDRCTVIVPSLETSDELTEAAERGPSHVVMPANLDLRHRILLASARRGTDAFEISERATALAGDLVAGFLHAPGPPRTGLSPRSLVLADQVRELLGCDPDRGLRGLAQEMGVSPFHLSRSFRHASGMTLTRYRRHLRMKRALQRFAEGETDLARLAADVGFADQAHFSRVTRAELGSTPGQLRRLLSRPSGAG